MGEDFLVAFLGNQSRAKLVRVFIFNQSDKSDPLTVVQLAKRAGLSTQSTNREIKILEKLGIIKRGKDVVQAKKKGKGARGKKKSQGEKQENSWFLDPKFKYLRALSSFVHEISPIRYNHILDVLKNTGRLSVVIASGCFMGDVTRPVDLIVVADNLNENRLENAIRSLEPLYGREIRYSTFGTMEFSYRLTIQDHLIRDILDYPNMILLDRAGVLK